MVSACAEAGLTEFCWLLPKTAASCSGERKNSARGLEMDVRDREADPSSRHPAATSRIAPQRARVIFVFVPELVPELVSELFPDIVPGPRRFTFKRSSEFTQIVPGSSFQGHRAKIVTV